MKWISLLIIIGLMLGPVGHLTQISPLVPNLLVVFLWSQSWFGSRASALVMAMVGGLLLDLVGWSWFGLWAIGSVCIVLVVNALKERTFEEGSILHALIALSIVSLITPLFLAIATRNLDLKDVVFVILGNVILGVAVYYLIAMRLRLFQQWAGRRIG